LSDFEIVKTSTGAASIRNKVVNEIMHNPVGPWREANDLYIEQSKLRLRLLESVESDLVLFDVGLGAASNALAAIHACLGLTQAAQRRLHIVSFENNLELLRFTLENAKAFEHLKGFEEALAILLSCHHWESPCGRVIWDLREGDFLEVLDQENYVPELVFYDPYSPAVNQEMWTLACFRKLRAHCATPESVFGTTLYTYSVATPVRAALLLSGFFVGHGIATGLKTETTQFSTRLDAINDPLSKAWFGRWVRSKNQLPYDVSLAEADVYGDLICGHAQMAPWRAFSGELIKAAFPGRKWTENSSERIEISGSSNSQLNDVHQII
jgi:tRNA U34 5-methylaminomethyl-2-thiouridine-forming methyltransferase MnmC